MNSTCLTKSWAEGEGAYWRILLALLLALGLALCARGGTWARLTSEFDSAQFSYEPTYHRLESDPADASRKSVAFTFSSLYPAERLSLELLQPRAASGFASDPPAKTTRQDARYGFSYHQVVSGLLAAGQSTLSGMGIAPMGLAVGEVSPWLALLFGALTAAGTVRLVGRGKRPSKQVPGKQGPAVRQKRDGTQTAAQRPNWPGRYCPGCGERQVVGALYCNRCGSQISIEMRLEAEPYSQDLEWLSAGEEGR